MKHCEIHSAQQSQHADEFCSVCHYQGYRQKRDYRKLFASASGNILGKEDTDFGNFLYPQTCKKEGRKISQMVFPCLNCFAGEVGVKAKPSEL